MPRHRADERVFARNRGSEINSDSLPSGAQGCRGDDISTILRRHDDVSSFAVRIAEERFSSSRLQKHPVVRIADNASSMMKV